MTKYFGFNTHLQHLIRHASAVLFALIGTSFAQTANADTLRSFKPVQYDAFYHQLLKLPDDRGYLPTRSFTIIVDTEHGNQLVAEDDPNLRFNLLWMQQFETGYRSRHGGAAFGELFRSYLKMAYKSYREHNAESMSALPDETGSIRAKHNATNLIDTMDYNLKVTGDEVRLKIQYNY